MKEWQAALDKVKRELNVGTEKELAEMLGVSPQALNQYRKTNTGLGGIPKLKLLELEGERDLTTALDTIEPERKRPPKIRRRAVQTKTKQEREPEPDDEGKQPTRKRSPRHPSR